ncbi:ABC transporter substrate-binding protein [Micrococcaceae sp. AOP34-BR2-30]
MKCRRQVFIVGFIGMFAIAGCAAEDPYAEEDSDGGAGSIVVGSANFSENVLVGEIYAQALESAGFEVQRELNIGAREVLYSQVENCTLDVVPEYNQALLAFIAPTEDAQGTEEINAGLEKNLPDSLEILESSEAQNNNAVAVTQEIADEFALETIEDLAAVSVDMRFGGPTEWKTRSDGFAGLESDYGVDFQEYVTLDYSGPITLSALSQGDIEAALLFSTTPQIESDGYVVLDDPLTTIGVNNITPLVCNEAVSEDARATLNAVSSALNTEDLAKLNAAYTLDHRDANDVATEWLEEKGL